MLTTLIELLAALTPRCFEYFAAPNTKAPYIVWGVNDTNDFEADGKHTNRASVGSIDLFTKSSGDALIEKIEAALEEADVAWDVESIQYEDETGLIHYEWSFEAL